MSGFRQELDRAIAVLIGIVLITMMILGLYFWAVDQPKGTAGPPDPNAGECASTWC